MTDDSPREKLNLYQATNYKIVVVGEAEGDWYDWVEPSTTIEHVSGEVNTTVIAGVFDQAALHGILRRLYSLGFPLVSVKWLHTHNEAEEER